MHSNGIPEFFGQENVPLNSGMVCGYTIVFSMFFIDYINVMVHGWFYYHIDFKSQFCVFSFTALTMPVVLS